MLARRGRLNLKPNVAKGGPKPAADLKKEESLKTEPDSLMTKSTFTSTIYAVPTIEEPTTSVDPVFPEATAFWPPPEAKRISRVPAVHSPTPTECSEFSSGMKNVKKKFNGEEALDTKNMRIMDMIYWNPKKGQALTRNKHSLDDSLFLPTSSAAPKPSISKTTAPQVKVGPDGNIILDESSLLVEGAPNETSFWETVDDDRMGKKTTSLSFRNRLWRKGTQWTEKETELFYEILRCTGPDFGLMHEYFPGRARRELKSKYNREERTNWSKLKEAMSMPMVLDESLSSRVERLQKEIDEAAEEKAREKEKKNRKGKGAANNQTDGVRKKGEGEVSRVPARIDWDEEKADLVAEAEQIIREMEKDSMERARGADVFLSSSGDNSSSDEDFVKEKNIKKKKLSSDARKIITAVRKSTQKPALKEKEGVKDLKPAKCYSGFEEIPDDPAEKDDPTTVQDTYPVPNRKRDGVTHPALLKAVRQARKANDKMVKKPGQKNSLKSVKTTAAVAVPVKQAGDMPVVIEPCSAVHPDPTVPNVPDVPESSSRGLHSSSKPPMIKAAYRGGLPLLVRKRKVVPNPP